jgi:ribonuclease P protein component
MITALSLPAARRLQSDGDFQRLWKSGKRFSLANLKLIYSANDLGYPRLGISIAKKQVRLATARNRLKRVVRETFRLYQAQLPACDIIVAVYRGMETLPPAEQYQQLTALWTQFVAKSNKS